MSSGDFAARMRHLIDSCGTGRLESHVEVDQVYAKYQELRDDLAIRLEGQHHYTRDALYGQIGDVMQAWAETLVTPDGSELQAGAERAAETLSQGVYDRAPLEFGDLKASGHPTVLDKGAVTYDRPPMIHRLSREELAAKGDLRRLGFGNSPADDVDLAVRLGAQ